MATCPAGHDSNDLDFCDVCGADMAGSAAPASAAPLPGSHLTPPPDEPAPRPGETCPRCGAPRSGRFCEEDGYDFVLGAERPPPSNATAHLNVATPATPTIPTASTKLAKQAAAAKSGKPAGKPKRGWTAVVSADRVYFDKVMAEGGPDAMDIAFPPYCPDRVVPLTGSQIRIGRRSVTRSVTPEIDLSEPPEDVGVSHIHAVLLARPDGSWVLVDPGSTNGTTVNDSTDPISVNAEIRVGDGDRIHVGAWTTITLRKD